MLKRHYDPNRFALRSNGIGKGMSDGEGWSGCGFIISGDWVYGEGIGGRSWDVMGRGKGEAQESGSDRLEN